MTQDVPSQFYTGLVAELYASLRGSIADIDLCERVVREFGEPALELGCGHGDPLIELRRRGLDVDGLDSSIDMLDRARALATEHGVDVELHHADMSSMQLGKRFQTVFLAGPTFNLLPSDDTATAALRCIADHLADNGRAFIPLFVPTRVNPDAPAEPKEHVEPDGTLFRCTVTSTEYDVEARMQVTTLLYERIDGDKVTTVERPWLLHWYTPDGFRALVESAGLVVESINDYHGEPARPDSTYMHVTCRRASPTSS